jgi:hypothetical protein
MVLNPKPSKKRADILSILHKKSRGSQLILGDYEGSDYPKSAKRKD